MPRIPVYDTPQVQLRDLPSVQRNIGPVGQGMQALAQGLGAASDVLTKAREEADQIRAEEAFNKLREVQNILTYGDGKYETGATNIKAGNVFNRDQPFGQEYMTRFDKAAQEIEAGLSSDNQKRMFQRATGRAKLEFGGTLARHEAAEGNTYRESVYKGVIESETEHVAKNFTDLDAVAQSIERVKANTRGYAMRQGMAADQQDMAVKDAVSSMHMLVIQRKLDGDPTKGVSADPAGAKQYYQDQVKAGVIVESSKAAKTMRDKIEADERSMRASTAVDAIWKGFGPDSDTEAVNLDAMAAELRGQFKNDPDGLKVAMADLKERASTHDYSVRQREASITGGIFQRVLAGESLAAIRKSPEFRELDGVRQIDMVTKIENFQKRGQDGEGAQMDKFASYWAVASNPQKLASMSDAEIFAMAPKVGTTLVKQLLVDKQKLSKGEDKVRAATIDNDQFKYWASEGGLKVNPKKDSDDEKTLGELKYRVETVIDDQQRALGRDLTRKEKDDIMKRLVVEVPVRMVTRGGFNDGRISVENKRVFQVQDARNIVVQGADREQVIKDLKAVGITNPTEAQIREGFVRLKAR